MTYNEYITNIIKTRGQWNIPKGEYFEQHHIIPVCLGGSGDTKQNTFRRKSHHSNCIWLYANEHYIAHKLLALENPENYKLVYSWTLMAYSAPPQYVNSRSYLITEDDYKKMKELAASVAKTLPKYHGHPWNFGKKNVYNEETLKLIGEASKGRNCWLNVPVDSEGFKWSKESRLAQSKAMKGHKEGGKASATSRKGKHYYTNGAEIKMYVDGEQPEGWVKSNANKANGKKWYNNGIKNAFCVECPDGYVEGFINKRWQK